MIQHHMIHIMSSPSDLGSLSLFIIEQNIYFILMLFILTSLVGCVMHTIQSQLFLFEQADAINITITIQIARS